MTSVGSVQTDLMNLRDLSLPSCGVNEYSQGLESRRHASNIVVASSFVLGRSDTPASGVRSSGRYAGFEESPKPGSGVRDASSGARDGEASSLFSASRVTGSGGALELMRFDMSEVAAQSQPWVGKAASTGPDKTGRAARAMDLKTVSDASHIHCDKRVVQVSRGPLVEAHSQGACRPLPNARLDKPSPRSRESPR